MFCRWRVDIACFYFQIWLHIWSRFSQGNVAFMCLVTF
jgi:hypothetical protein